MDSQSKFVCGQRTGYVSMRAMRYKLYTDERGYHIFRSNNTGAGTRAEMLAVLTMLMLEDEERNREHIPDRRAARVYALAARAGTGLPIATE